MKVFAIGWIPETVSTEQRKQIAPKNMSAMLQHYLDGKIEQFWYRQDGPGVIFLMNVETVEQAKAELETPLLTCFAKFDFVPVGPLAPLGLLMQDQEALETLLGL
jgi:hypothetical protein